MTPASMECRSSIMALVPFRVSGAAADQTLEHRIFQIGQHTIKIDQDVHKSGSLQAVGGLPKSLDSSSGHHFSMLQGIHLMLHAVLRKGLAGVTFTCGFCLS